MAVATDQDLSQLLPDRPARRRIVGWRVVAGKELADHVTSIRFTVILLLLTVPAFIAIYAASSNIRDVASQATGVPSLFLRLFTVTADSAGIFSFLTLLEWVAPLLGIVFGFDAVNGERSQGTLPRLVAQPIFRDDVINGKFASGLTIIAVALFSLVLLVSGLAMIRLGIAPSATDVLRLIAWFAVTLVYVSFWLAFATMCSVLMRGAATSAIVAFSAWLVLAIFWGLLSGLLAGTIAPVPDQPTADEVFRNQSVEMTIGRLSPARLYDEATQFLLDPETRTLSTYVRPTQIDPNFAVSGPLSLPQSLLQVWGQIVALIGLTVLCFVVAYINFMQQEIRA